MSQFQNFSTIINQENNIKRQIDGLTQQLQQMQNIRNQMMQSQQMPQQNTFTIEAVENFDNISANSVPMDKGAFFILNNGKEIQYRHWNAAGEIVKSSYFPQTDNNSNETTPNEEKTKNEVSDEFTDTLNNLIERVDKIEQSLKPKRVRTKKDGAEDDEQKSDDK